MYRFTTGGGDLPWVSEETLTQVESCTNLRRCRNKSGKLRSKDPSKAYVYDKYVHDLQVNEEICNKMLKKDLHRAMMRLDPSCIEAVFAKYPWMRVFRSDFAPKLQYCVLSADRVSNVRNDLDAENKLLKTTIVNMKNAYEHEVDRVVGEIRCGPAEQTIDDVLGPWRLSHAMKRVEPSLARKVLHKAQEASQGGQSWGFVAAEAIAEGLV